MAKCIIIEDDGGIHLLRDLFASPRLRVKQDCFRAGWGLGANPAVLEPAAFTAQTAPARRALKLPRGTQVSFLSREDRLNARVTNAYLLIWAAIWLMLLVTAWLLDRLTGLPGNVVLFIAAGLTPVLQIPLRRKFDARIRDHLDGGY
jgi:hypothetical protein